VSQDEEGQTIVNVVDAKGEPTPRAVTIGLSSNKNVEIRKGLRTGEHVALPEPQAAAGEGD
jgi:multidrug efflux pump subunit AcrA (membrane-fusion protein)